MFGPGNSQQNRTLGTRISRQNRMFGFMILRENRNGIVCLAQEFHDEIVPNVSDKPLPPRFLTKSYLCPVRFPTRPRLHLGPHGFRQNRTFALTVPKEMIAWPPGFSTKSNFAITFSDKIGPLPRRVSDKIVLASWPPNVFDKIVLCPHGFRLVLAPWRPRASDGIVPLTSRFPSKSPLGPQGFRRNRALALMVSNNIKGL